MISIIIPTLNEEKIIEKTLKSLRKFNGDYEIIVSDGKSTDRTIEIAKQYTNKVIVYDGISRQTIAMGRNLGASIAQGEYLIFLDADVFIPDINNFFEKAITSFEKDSELVGLTVCLKVLPEKATVYDNIISSIMNYIIFINNNIIHIGSSTGEFQMIKNDTFKKIGGYNEKLVVAEDNEFFSRLARVGRTKINPKLVVFQTGRRVHKIGWPKLLMSWWINQLSVNLFHKSFNKEWEEIR